MLKRDFPERSAILGQGPAVKRQDVTGAQGRLVSMDQWVALDIIFCHLEIVQIIHPGKEVRYDSLLTWDVA